MMLIGYHSNDTYKLYSPNDDKLVIDKDVLVDKIKWWNWTQGLVQHEQDTIEIMLEEDQENDVTTNQNEEPLEQNVRSSFRTRTESTRLDGYERFPNQAIDADGDFIDKVVKKSEQSRRTRPKSL